MATSPPMPRRSDHLPWLDVLRAVAALLVLLSHVRQFTLRDAADQPALTLPARIFFAVSGLGHQAVIVFFVLSGFLVAGSMRSLAAAGRWSLWRFAIERLSRLWPVLIPCLLLGGLLDGFGLQLTAGPADHYGRLALTAPSAPPARDGVTLLGNMLFLQTIATPVYGSNGPLWSLADEAWFYALAALAFSAWQGRTRRGWPLPLAAFVLVTAWLPTAVLTLFPIWASGAAGRLFATRSKKSSGDLSWPRFGIAVFCVVAALVVSRLRIGPGSLPIDWLLGLATAGLLGCVASLPWPDRPGLRTLRGLSALSYGLYLSHVPVLALLTTLLVGSDRLEAGLASTAIMFLDVVVALACAAGLWWAFERHTPAVRRLVLRRLPLTGSPAALIAGRSSAR